MNTSTGKFQRIANVKDNKGTIGSAEIIALAYDATGTLWVGSMNGITTLKSKDGVYPSQTTRSPINDALKNKGILHLFADSKENLWIGTSTGLYRYNLNKKQLTSFNEANNSDSLQSDYINCVTENANGELLIGTNSGGLSIYDTKRNTFKTFTENDGLVNNNVLGIIEDNSGNLWISTANGLSEFNPKTKRFRNYTKSDGLAGNEFNNRSYFKDSSGEIFFGGINGLTSFYPTEIQSNNYISPLVFTGLRLFNKPVNVDEENGILKNNLNLTEELDFSYDQNNFTLEFSLLNYVKPDKNKYAYKLEGYDKEWKFDSTPIASYTNLPSGNYRFVVKGINNDGIPGSAIRALKIHINPAPWLSWWAYLGYAIVLSGILFLTLRYFFIRALLKRTENVQQMKLKFFTHVSHEIRTPLTLILGPLESLLKNTAHLPELHQQVVPIKNNADRLLRLITELMDFRKTETGNMKLHLEELDIVQFIQYIFNAFKDLATSKHINYRIETPAQPIQVWIDRVQLEKVFFNLLSNAFKFTSDNGMISVTVKDIEQQVSIEIRDNGIGIPESSKDKLFSDFFQIDTLARGILVRVLAWHYLKV
ncbi:sensor histidine kinase [Pedobacter sp. SL55]|uniref:sensor histidine kinase n=1 Tax=Pedobacter sp. SL55 TaxID=2995161 RepID=UPI00226F8685|nr:sensor histidine kinase [Pedobacter sp. SL55]WAC41314.1 triple tyrosine motif-containing protein [Pedobacter sp. SL55]